MKASWTEILIKSPAQGLPYSRLLLWVHLRMVGNNARAGKTRQSFDVVLGYLEVFFFIPDATVKSMNQTKHFLKFLLCK